MSWRLGIILGLLAMAAAGCAPKRVTSGSVVTTRRPPEVGGPVAETGAGDRTGSPVTSELPDPEPLRRSGEATLSPPDPGPGSQPTALGLRAVKLAKAQLGKPYQWGAAGPEKFDCSGLVQYVFSNLGVPLPRVSRQQASAGRHVDRKDLKPGDLVFFTLSGPRIDHVGIYIGHSEFIHAPRRYNPVRKDSLNNTWWLRRFKGGRRMR